jgi:hypothetical protein
MSTEEAMFRRSVSIIVMFGFVTGQMAAFPHAHAENGEPFDHDARPHIHLSWFEHVGDCHNDGHAHHHDHDGDDSQRRSLDTNVDHDDHDSDAVYLPTDIGVSLPTKSIESVHNFDVTATLAIPVAPLPTFLTDCVTGQYFSGDCSPGRPLWLVLRALRL